MQLSGTNIDLEQTYILTHDKKLIKVGYTKIFFRFYTNPRTIKYNAQSNRVE